MFADNSLNIYNFSRTVCTQMNIMDIRPKHILEARNKWRDLVNKGQQVYIMVLMNDWYL